jgi:hypothetical protein
MARDEKGNDRAKTVSDLLRESCTLHPVKPPNAANVTVVLDWGFCAKLVRTVNFANEERPSGLGRYDEVSELHVVGQPVDHP